MYAPCGSHPATLRSPTTSPDWICCGPGLEHLHVFHWHLQTGERRPLAEGEDLWRDYLAQAAHPERTRYALLEFVQDDAPEAFLRDAATLLRWLGNYPDTNN